jgi:hypothetical protein
VCCQVEGSIVFCNKSLSDISSENMEEQAPKRSQLLFLNGKREYLMFDPLTKGDDSEVIVAKKFSKGEKEGKC